MKTRTEPLSPSTAYTSREADASPGDVIETVNGNRYVVMPGGFQLYIGNVNPNRIDPDEKIEVRPDNRCLIVGKVTINP